MKILSLFDGIACGRVALEKAGIKVDEYYASEIDKYAIKVAKANYSDILELGDVTKVRYMDGVISSQLACIQTGAIDLVMFGSPCQGFSNAGKRKNFDDPRSALFWHAARILDEVKPKYFLMENVVMKQEWVDVISDALQVEPIMIDSALISPAVRKRLYWTNIPNITQPEKKDISFGDIRERGVSNGPIYYSEKAMDWIHRHEKRTGKKLRIIQDDQKMQMLEASMYKKYSSQRFFGIEDIHGLRYITVTESERCMGLPDGYTSAVSNTQAYKELGNGWQTDTIAHIFSFLPEEVNHG